MKGSLLDALDMAEWLSHMPYKRFYVGDAEDNEGVYTVIPVDEETAAKIDSYLVIGVFEDEGGNEDGEVLSVCLCEAEARGMVFLLTNARELLRVAEAMYVANNQGAVH